MLPAFADGKSVYFMDIGPKFLDAQGSLSKEIMPDLLHPNEHGYKIWVEAVGPKLEELMSSKLGPATTPLSTETATNSIPTVTVKLTPLGSGSR